MQQPVTPAISTQCCTQDPSVNVNCHQTAAIVTNQVLFPQSKIIEKFAVTALSPLATLQTCQHIYNDISSPVQ
jgi:hypothetical protein